LLREGLNPWFFHGFPHVNHGFAMGSPRV
jgi:hypothetical protein